jgi:ribosome recycling factor
MIVFKFVEGAPQKDFEQAISVEMDKTVKFFEKELLKIRSGKAHTSMIEDIKVNSYGTMMPLKQVAALSAPDVNLLVIQPWDKGIIGDIEKAISTSDLEVTPVNDGNVIRIQLPRLSTERREELIKTLGKKLEETKVTLRNVRKDFHNLIREAEKGKKISEDYSKRLQDVLQKFTDKIIEMIDKLSKKKEDEIRSV